MEGAMTRSQYVLLFAAIGGAVLFAAASALFSRKGAAGALSNGTSGDPEVIFSKAPLAE